MTAAAGAHAGRRWARGEHLHDRSPLGALIVATLLAIVPSVLLRGPFRRLLRSRRRAV